MSRNLEVCAFSIKDVIKASSIKPARIEFCENKTIGGITPDLKLIDSAVSSGVPIFPIIRPRGGNFVYTQQEIDQMITSIKLCKEKKCQGVVFGVLDKNFSVDVETCKKIMDECKGLSATFHMAFDKCKDPLESMKKIIDLGFDRILTSGQEENVEDGLQLIEKLVRKSSRRISIMPGLKLRSSNIDKFLRNKEINDFHSSCYVKGEFSIEEATLLSEKISNS